MGNSTHAFGLAERVAIVTGAAHGIGAAIANTLAMEGARVLVADRGLDHARQLAVSLCERGWTAAATAVDVADAATVNQLPDTCRDVFGAPPEIIVANAGIQTFAMPGALRMKEWDQVLNVNARGTYLTLEMAYHTVPDGGAVVTVASLLGRTGSPYSPHYAASKAAVLSLTRTFALALAPRSVRVNAVAPGMIDTAMWAQADLAATRLQGTAPGAAREHRMTKVPLGRAGTPQDVADAVLFLASARASYITGETIHVCGGDLMI